MVTIGFRVAPTEVTFAVFNTDSRRLINVEKIVVPEALHWPECLKHVRCNLLDILREYGVERAGIRTTEPIAQSPNIQRLQLEGVIQEAFASSELISYFAGPIATLAKMVGTERSQLRPMIDAGENGLNIENWSEFDEKTREAVIAAIGAENA